MGYKRCSHFIWYNEEISTRAKELINENEVELYQHYNEIYYVHNIYIFYRISFTKCNEVVDLVQLNLKFSNLC